MRPLRLCRLDFSPGRPQARETDSAPASSGARRSRWRGSSFSGRAAPSRWRQQGPDGRLARRCSLAPLRLADQRPTGRRGRSPGGSADRAATGLGLLRSWHLRGQARIGSTGERSPTGSSPAWGSRVLEAECGLYFHTSQVGRLLHWFFPPVPSTSAGVCRGERASPRAIACLCRQQSVLSFRGGAAV
jgi:hypothetical protein